MQGETDLKLRGAMVGPQSAFFQHALGLPHWTMTHASPSAIISL